MSVLDIPAYSKIGIVWITAMVAWFLPKTGAYTILNVMGWRRMSVDDAFEIFLDTHTRFWSLGTAIVFAYDFFGFPRDDSLGLAGLVVACVWTLVSTCVLFGFILHHKVYGVAKERLVN